MALHVPDRPSSQVQQSFPVAADRRDSVPIAGRVRINHTSLPKPSIWTAYSYEAQSLHEAQVVRGPDHPSPLTTSPRGATDSGGARRSREQGRVRAVHSRSNPYRHSPGRLLQILRRSTALPNFFKHRVLSINAALRRAPSFFFPSSHQHTRA